MTLQNLIHVAKCPTCPNMVPVGRQRPDKPRRCDQCKNRDQYQKRRLLLKVKRVKQKRCHGCGGQVQKLGVHCSDYCKWITSLKHRHYKIILSIGDL